MVINSGQRRTKKARKPASYQLLPQSFNSEGRVVSADYELDSFEVSVGMSVPAEQFPPQRGGRPRSDSERERHYQDALRRRQGDTEGVPHASSETEKAAPAVGADRGSHPHSARGVDMRPAWLVEQEKKQWEQEQQLLQEKEAQEKQQTVPAPSISASVSSAKTPSTNNLSTRKRHVREEDGDGDGDGEPVAQTDDAMIAMLGFGTFSSTAGRHVVANDGAAAGYVSKVKKRKYRQYMNRTKGFNQNLEGGAV